MKSYLNFSYRGSCLLLFFLTLAEHIKANEVVPNDSPSNNQAATSYQQQQASASLANFNWLPGGGPTQYVSTYIVFLHTHNIVLYVRKSFTRIISTKNYSRANTVGPKKLEKTLKIKNGTNAGLMSMIKGFQT